MGSGARAGPLVYGERTRDPPRLSAGRPASTTRPGNRGHAMDLKNAVAVVTGGNGGLGQRIGHALAREGTHIAVVYAQSANEAGAVADELRKHGVKSEPFQCDLTKPPQIQKLVDDVVKRFGRL